MKNKKYIFGALAIVAIFVANISGAVTVLLPQNPNTGTILVGSSTTAYRNFATGTPGYVLTATSSSPYLTWAAGATGGGGSIGTSSAVTAGYFPYWGTASALTGTSSIFQLGALVGIGTTTPSEVLHVIGNGLFSGTLSASGYNSTNWDTAYTDRLKWDGGATGLTAATGRTSLGLGALATADTVPYASTTGVQSTISAGSNIVLTGASVAVTSTPSFASLGVTGNASINGTNSFFTVGTSTPQIGQIGLLASGVGVHDLVVVNGSNTTQFMAMTVGNPSGWKNPIVQAGDAGIHFSTNTNGFFIAPYSGSASGLRMATSGVVSVNSSQVITKATNKKYIQWTASYSTSTQTWFTPIFTFPNSATITRVLENSTSTGNNLTYNLYYSTSNTPKASMFKVFPADRTLTALSAPTSTTTFASSTPSAMSGLWIDQSNASSTDLNITIEWIEN